MLTSENYAWNIHVYQFMQNQKRIEYGLRLNRPLSHQYINIAYSLQPISQYKPHANNKTRQM